MGRMARDANASTITPRTAPPRTIKIGARREYDNAGAMKVSIYLPALSIEGSGSLNPTWAIECAAAGLMTRRSGDG